MTPYDRKQVITELEERQMEIISEIQNLKNEKDLYEEDDTTYIDEEIECLENELASVSDKLEMLTSV